MNRYIAEQVSRYKPGETMQVQGENCDVFDDTFRSGIHQLNGKFETEHFDLQLSNTWHAFSTFTGGQGDVYFDDGERKIDMIIAFDDTIEFDPAR